MQGEGRHMGDVVSFLRLSGCNKWSGLEEHKPKSICHFCDTDFFDYVEMDANEIVERLSKINANTVIISGGEPLKQLEMGLLQKLKEAEFKIHLETNGSLSLGNMVLMFDHVSMSPKQSFEETKLEYCDDIKFLYPWISPDIVPARFEEFNYRKLYLQPIEERHHTESNQKRTIELCLQNRWSLSPQLHKVFNLK